MIRLILIAALIVGGCTVPKVQAQSLNGGWPYTEFSDEPKVERHHPVNDRYVYRPSLTREASKPRKKPEVESYRVVIRDERDKPEPKGHCMPELSVVGDQAVSEDGARTQALKAWSQETRFRYGELWMDPEHAGDLAYRCAHSGVRNVVNRATEAVGISTQAWRCQAIARPCAAPVVREGQ